MPKSSWWVLPCALSLLLPQLGCQGVSSKEDLESFVESRLTALGAVSFTAGIVRGEELVWSMSRGMADAEAGVPATTDTVYRIASISKPVTGLAAMALVEQGRLDLDADVGTYLPIAVRNPHRPEVPITARMLMSHSSSIVDDWEYFDTLTGVPEPAMPLEELVRTCLTDERRPEEWKRSFLAADPGTVSAYSNMGVALLAWVVESIAGVPFATWTESALLRPLGLTQAAWYESLMPGGVEYARPYGYDRTQIAQYRVPAWPAGSFLCSAKSFSRLAAVFVNRGVVGGTRILQESSLKEMEAIASGNYGLSVERIASHPDQPQLRGHFGDIPGFHSGFLYDPDRSFGVYYFAAGEFDHTMLRAEAETALLKAARELDL